MYVKGNLAVERRILNGKLREGCRLNKAFPAIRHRDSVKTGLCPAPTR